MAYVWATWLADALRAEGCTVVEESGWKQRGRPSSSGPFSPYGVLWHHTGTTASTSNPCPTLGMCINGRPDLSGPLCHVVIGYDGVCHVIAAGRANHAGSCNGFGPFSSGDGNSQLIGFEIDYNGTQPMSAAQWDAASRGSSACLKRFGRSSDYAARHEETSGEGKWDPGGTTGTQVRASVAAYMSGEGDDEMGDVTVIGISGDAAAVISKQVWERYKPGGKNLATHLGEISQNMAWVTQALQDVAAATGTRLADPPPPLPDVESEEP